MIKKGDRVKFISDTTIGVVSSIDGNIAKVKIEDGFEIPALLSDIVAVDPAEESEAIKKMGIGDGKPISKTPKGQQVKEKKVKKTESFTSRYGKISLTNDYEDEDPIDIQSLRQNYQRAVEKKNNHDASSKPEPSPVELMDYDVKLCFVPDNTNAPHQSDKWEVYIVNDSSYRIIYSLSQWHKNEYVSHLGHGMLENDSKESITALSRNQVNDGIKLLVNICLFKPADFIPQPVEDFDLDISALKFTRQGNYVETCFFDEKVLVYTLASSQEKHVDKPVLPIVPQIKKEDAPVVNKSKKNQEEPEIIDLHAEEVLDSTESLTPGEIIHAQISRFEIALDLAVRNNRGGKMVFIHGVGSGKLKYEMQKLLKQKYPKIRYQDASFKEYGYGAMMIYL
ncbi:MAG: DUF2027 domain-containing protein [Rikenellaceae bacterium]|nr:DUF2027 domain-containing protein [Rikenellaceae bacterium]